MYKIVAVKLDQIYPVYNFVSNSFAYFLKTKKDRRIIVFEHNLRWLLNRNSSTMDSNMICRSQIEFVIAVSTLVLHGV